MLKRDLTAEEEKEAAEIAARLSCCVADILTADFAADTKVSRLLMETRCRFDMLQLKIGARRERVKQERERQRREAEEAFAARERERERYANVHGHPDDRVYHETTPGDADVSDALKDLWKRTEESHAHPRPKPDPTARPYEQAKRARPTISIDFDAAFFRSFYGAAFSGGKTTRGATQRSPHDELRYRLREIAGNAWREGMSDAELFKAAQAKAHPDRCAGDGTLFKKVTDLGQRLGVVDDQGRVKV